MSEEQLPPVLARIRDLGFAVFERGAYNLNMFGIRSPENKAGKFDDLIGCAYRDEADGPWRVDYWRGTLDPGAYWLENPMRVDGCAAIVCDRQYRGMWKVGLHRGQYRALVQVGEVEVYRDNNLDRVLDRDESTIMRGLFGINGHRAGADSSVVDKWSAGCQVVARRRDHDAWMDLVDKSLEEHPTWSRFTYTPLNRWW